MFVFGADAAERLLGDRDDATRREIVKNAAKFSAVDFLDFDPRVERPPRDVPELCPKWQLSEPSGRDPLREMPRRS